MGEGKSYVVFEAGSRAGLSAKTFFLDYQARYRDNRDVLYMVDTDEMFSRLVDTEPTVFHCDYDTFVNRVSKAKSLEVFPADELTRQRGLANPHNSTNIKGGEVEKSWYDKVEMNLTLDRAGINVPKTFGVSDVFIKPRTESAGSKGLLHLENMCVSEYIDIESEYVVDCYVDDKFRVVFPREVKLKNGYDQYVRFISRKSDVAKFAEHIIESIDGSPFRGIFHIQIMMERNTGKLYYIESSNRISGTSLVNLILDYNPFDFLNGEYGRVRSDGAILGNWFRYDDLYSEVIRKIAR